jgi:hypothetical protein
MATAAVRTADAPVQRRPQVRPVLERLAQSGAIAAFGDAGRGWTSGFDTARFHVEDVATIGDRPVALVVQRGRVTGGEWVERRLSVVFGDGGGPELHDSWVAGLHAASRDD